MEVIKLYIVKDGLLDLIPVNPVYFSDKEVVIKGLPNGTQFLSKPIPGAYAGMRVKIYEEGTAESKTE